MNLKALLKSKGIKRILGCVVIAIAVIGKSSGLFELDQLAAVSKLLESVTGIGLFGSLVTFGAGLAGIGVAHAMAAGNMKGLIALFKGQKGATTAGVLKTSGVIAVVVAGGFGIAKVDNKALEEKVTADVIAAIDSTDAAQIAAATKMSDVGKAEKSPTTLKINNLETAVGKIPLCWKPDHKYKGFLYDSSAAGEVLLVYSSVFTAAADYPKEYGKAQRGVFKLETVSDKLSSDEIAKVGYDSIAVRLGIEKPKPDTVSVDGGVVKDTIGAGDIGGTK